MPLLPLLTRLRTQYSCYTLIVLQLFLQPGYCQPYIIHCRLPLEAVQNHWLLWLRWKFRICQWSYLLHIWHFVEEWSGLTLLFGLGWSLHIGHWFEYHVCYFFLSFFLFGLLHLLLGLFQRLQHLPIYLVIERRRKITLFSSNILFLVDFTEILLQRYLFLQTWPYFLISPSCLLLLNLSFWFWKLLHFDRASNGKINSWGLSCVWIIRISHLNRF